MYAKAMSRGEQTKARAAAELARQLHEALLRDRSHSIADVALACGFATQSHFTLAFKSRTGVTPGAYRRGCPPDRASQ